VDGEQIHTVIPLIAGDQCMGRGLRSAAVQRESVGDHVDEQLFHQGGQGG
jgi:hypothetical protein